MNEFEEIKEFSITSINIYQQHQPKQTHCVFCPKLFNYIDTAIMVNRALYLKYAASQNYYYSKQIEKFLHPTELKNNNSLRKEIAGFFDFATYKEDFEHLQEYYENSWEYNEQTEKLTFLVEYYKYHSEVPRIFTQTIREIMEKF